MNEMKALTAHQCKDLEPLMFAVNMGAGEKLAPRIQKLMDPVVTDSFHCWMAKKEQATKLHYHDHDEYWAWCKGRSMATIRLPDGRSDTFEISPGWVVFCLRGVEHGHEPLEDWGAFEWVGTIRPGIRFGQLHREL